MSQPLVLVEEPAVSTVCSVGANEISEGLLARSELPPRHSVTGAKQEELVVHDTGLEECAMGDCIRFSNVIFHTFKSSYNTVSSKTTKTDNTIPAGPCTFQKSNKRMTFVDPSKCIFMVNSLTRSPLNTSL